MAAAGPAAPLFAYHVPVGMQDLPWTTALRELSTVSSLVLSASLPALMAATIA